MKALNKKLITVLAVMAFVFIALAFWIMPIRASASTSGFSMKNGAEAKMTVVEGSDTDYTGIRFTSTVKESFYNNLLATHTGANIEIYTRVSPKASDIEDFDVAPSEYAVDIKCSQPVVFDGDPNTDDVFTIRAAIVDFPVELYDLELYARAYIKVDGENLIPADAADNVRSVRDVANAAIIDGYDEEGVLAKYIEVGQRNETTSGYITKSGKGYATIGGLTEGTYDKAYIGAKKINATVENGVVNFELSENELSILADKKVGDSLSLSVYDADGKVYSTFITLTDVPFVNASVVAKDVEGPNGTTVKAYSLNKTSDSFQISADYIAQLEAQGVKTVKLWFTGGAIFQISTITEGIYEWQSFDSWTAFDNGRRINAKADKDGDYFYHYSNTVLSVEELATLQIAWQGETTTAIAYIETFTDNVPVITGAEYTTKTEMIGGEEITVYTVSVPNTMAGMHGFSLSNQYLAQLTQDGVIKVSIMMKATNHLNPYTGIESPEVNHGWWLNTPGEYELLVGTGIAPADMVKYRIYGLAHDSIVDINNGVFEFYIIEEKLGEFKGVVFSNVNVTETSVEGPNGQMVNGYNLAKTGDVFRVSAEYIAYLRLSGVKAVKLWFTGGAIFQTYPYKEGMEWLPFDSWTAYDAGIRTNKEENWVGSTQYYYHYSETVFTLEDLATLQIAWMGEPTTATAYIETFTDNVPVITGVEYTTRTETIGDEEVVVYSVNVKDNALKVPAYGLMRGFGLSKAYLAQLAEEDIYSVKIMMKTSGMYLHPHSGDSSPTDHGWWATDTDYKLCAGSEQTLTDVVDYRIYALVHGSTPAMSDGEVFEFYIVTSYH